MADEHGYDFLVKNSSFDDIKSIIDECENKSLEILTDNEIKSIISYIRL